MTNRLQQIQHLYRAVLGREADEGGLDSYLKSNLSLYDIQLELWRSDEFKNKFNQAAYEPTTLDNKLPIFVINLERRPDRKQLIESRLANLGIKNYEIVKAVDGVALPVDTSEIYNNEKATQLQRALQKTEIACALSHIEVAKKIVNDNLEYAVILEDDAELTLEFKQFIEAFDLESGRFDCLILGSFSSNQFFNEKVKTSQSPYRLIEKESITYLGRIESWVGQTSIHKSHYPTQALDYVHGAHAYMLSNKGARKLIELNYPVSVEADNWWNYFSEECTVLFSNPILAHRQHEDSDIRNERKQVADNINSYSDNFKKRNSHIDYGT